MAFTRVTNAHGPSPQPTACRSPTCSMMTVSGSNQAQGPSFGTCLRLLFSSDPNGSWCNLFFLQRQNYEPTLAIFSRYWVNFNCWKWPNIERQNLVIWSHCRFSRFKGLLPESSVPILGNFFKIFGKFSRVYLALGQSSNLLWEFWFLWAYFHFIINGQILDT